MTNDFLEFFKSILSATVSLIVVLTAMKKFGQRFFDGEWVETMKRQEPVVKEFHQKIFEAEWELMHATHARARRTHDELEAHREDFKTFRREIETHMQVLILIPGSVERLTQSLNRFDQMVSALVQKIHQHELDLATFKARHERINSGG